MSWTQFADILILSVLGWVFWQEFFSTRKVENPAKRAADFPVAKNQRPPYAEVTNRSKSSSLVLLHFTAADNLTEISSRGLLTRTSLSSLPQEKNLIVNDHFRHDMKIAGAGAICLSVGHPNPAVFDAYRQKYPGRKYVVLELSDYLLADKNTFIVCPTNAASATVSGMWRRTPHLMQGDEAVAELFASRIMRRKNFGQTVEEFVRPASLPPALTTDPQAEILYQKNINRTRILKIHVEDVSVQVQVDAVLAEAKWPVEVCVTPVYFSPRSDSRQWLNYRTDTEDFGRRVMGRRGN